MMKQRTRGPEYTGVQRPAWELLRNHCGYEYANGSDPDFAAERVSEAEPLLLGRLAEKLREINPGLSDAGVRQAIDALRQPMAAALVDANETCHRLLSRWVTVEEMQAGKPVGRSVRYINWDEPEANDFLVVEEYTVKGPRWRRRLERVQNRRLGVARRRRPGQESRRAKAMLVKARRRWRATKSPTSRPLCCWRRWTSALRRNLTG